MGVCVCVWGGGGDDKADRSGKTASGNGQAWSSPKSQRPVGNVEKWRKLVVKSSVLPQRLSRLRDRRRLSALIFETVSHIERINVLLLTALKLAVSKISKVSLRPRQIPATSHPHPPFCLVIL